MEKKAILTEALNDINTFKDSIKKNANKVLKSTLKEEFESILNKATMSEDDDEDDFEEFSDSDISDTEMGSDDDMEMSSDDTEMGSDDDMEMGSDDDVIDLTNEPIDKAMSEFEKMDINDQIEIVKDDNGGIQINIKSPDAIPQGPTMDIDDESDDMDDMGDEPIDSNIGDDNEEDGYEIELDDEEEDEKEKISTLAENKINELRNSLVTTRRMVQKLIKENKEKDSELKRVAMLSEKLKRNEKEYKTTIIGLKENLKEVALYTTNLTKAVQLMTEHSTTKQEKVDILRKLDEAKTVREAEIIYEGLQKRLTEKKPIDKVSKVINETKVTTSVSEKNIKETKTFDRYDRVLELNEKLNIK